MVMIVISCSSTLLPPAQLSIPRCRGCEPDYSSNLLLLLVSEGVVLCEVVVQG